MIDATAILALLCPVLLTQLIELYPKQHRIILLCIILHLGVRHTAVGYIRGVQTNIYSTISVILAKTQHNIRCESTNN